MILDMWSGAENIKKKEVGDLLGFVDKRVLFRLVTVMGKLGVCRMLENGLNRLKKKSIQLLALVADFHILFLRRLIYFSEFHHM